MILYKFCKFCGKRFDRKEGLNSHNWKIINYCCTDHQIKYNNTHRAKLRRKSRDLQKQKTESRMKNYYEEKKAREEYKGSRTLKLQSILCRPFHA